jgi:hypothetical protein
MENDLEVAKRNKRPLSSFLGPRGMEERALAMQEGWTRVQQEKKVKEIMMKERKSQETQLKGFQK